MREMARGPDHPDTMVIVWDSARVCRGLRKIPEARAHYLRYKDWAEVHFGVDHSKYKPAVTCLARLDELEKEQRSKPAQSGPEASPQSEEEEDEVVGKHDIDEGKLRRMARWRRFIS